MAAHNPAVMSALVSDCTDSPVSASRAETLPVPHGPHIVVVDDDPEIRAMVGRVLAMHQYRVTTCADGLEALARLADINDAAAVLTDLRMPGMGGLPLMRALKERDFAGPILAMSGGVGPDDHERAELRTRCAAFLPKPFAPRTLLAALEAALHRPALS